MEPIPSNFEGKCIEGSSVKAFIQLPVRISTGLVLPAIIGLEIKGPTTVFQWEETFINEFDSLDQLISNSLELGDRASGIQVEGMFIPTGKMLDDIYSQWDKSLNQNKVFLESINIFHVLFCKFSLLNGNCHLF